MTDERSQQPGASSAESDPLAADPELRKELAAMFLDDGPAQLEAVRTAMANHDARALQGSAHTLKGSVGVFKDQAAYEAALRMEHVGRDADWQSADDAWQVLEREVKRLTAEVAVIAGREASPAGGGAD